MKNKYGNKAGCHSPKRTLKNLKYLRKNTGLDILDISWHNDLVDSLEISIFDLHIFLPNSHKQDDDKELFNTYYVSINSRYGSSDEPLFCNTDIDLLVKYLKKLIKKSKRFVLLHSVGTWIDKITGRTSGALIDVGSGDSDEVVDVHNFMNDSMSLTDDDISEDWVDSLSDEDHKIISQILLSGLKPIFKNHLTLFNGRLEVRRKFIDYVDWEQICQDYNLKHGDLAPEQHMRIEMIIKQYINQNNGDKIV